jgi:hypothetical protein
MAALRLDYRPTTTGSCLNRHATAVGSPAATSGSTSLPRPLSANRRPPPPLSPTLRDAVLRQDDVKLITVSGDDVIASLPVDGTSDSDAALLRRRLRGENDVGETTVDEAVGLLTAVGGRSASAFVGESATTDYVASRDCRLVEFAVAMETTLHAIGVQRGSPYRHRINDALLRLTEQGFVRKLQNKWWGSGRQCDGGNVTSSGSAVAGDDGDVTAMTSSSVDRLGVDELAPLFILLGVSLAASVGIAVGQCYRRRRPVRAKRTPSNKTSTGNRHAAVASGSAAYRRQNAINVDNMQVIHHNSNKNSPVAATSAAARSASTSAMTSATMQQQQQQQFDDQMTERRRNSRTYSCSGPIYRQTNIF